MSTTLTRRMHVARAVSVRLEKSLPRVTRLR
jgi:hypothetical protein